MVKVSSSDILAILRAFSVAKNESVPRHIDMIRMQNPGPTNTLISFSFNGKKHHILFDDTAGDNVKYTIQQIAIGSYDVQGELLQNPIEQSIVTYALPYKGKDVYLFIESSSKVRLDQFLARQYPEYSRSAWQKYVKAGYVSVNDEQQLSPKVELILSDKITTSVPKKDSHQDKTLPILYIDDNVIVIHKPIGVLSHSKGVLNDEFSVATFFSRYCGYKADTNRPGIVHRLDRDTSGIMIGARNDSTAQLLQRQFSQRTVKKTYCALVEGSIKKDEAIINAPIIRNPAKPSTFKVDPKGKPAETRFKVLKRSARYTYIELFPKTGRTHQLRVHLQFLKYPIVGDRLYGKEDERLFLHAHQLEITIPDGQRRVFTAPLPKSFDVKMDQDA